MKVKKIIKIKHPSIKALVLKCDTIFSRYKRLSNAKTNGDVECFTCGGIFNWVHIDCGHYISRMYKTVRWDEQNTEPQCPSCNRFHEGKKDVFALKLQEKYGRDILEELNRRKNKVHKFTIPELNELYEYYKDKVRELENG
jgi:hypothetical protein